MRDNIADYTEVAVSANTKQAALNTAIAADTAMLVPKTFIMGLEAKRETNDAQATGKEEPDKIYDKGYSAGVSMPFDMAQPQHAAFLLAYHYGSVSSAAWGGGFIHTITPVAGVEVPSVPCFTLVEQVALDLFKRRFPDLFVDTFKAKWDMDKWLNVEGGIKGSGKFDESVTQETKNAAYNAASLVLAANGVQGATAAARLANIDHVRVQVPATGEMVDVVVTAVSDAVPAVLTITPVGGADVTLTDYEIIYVPTEPAWCTLPAKVDEPPLLVANMICKVGGEWNGAAFVGGHSLDKQFKSIEHSSQIDMKLEPRPADGFSGLYANSAKRMGRKQTLAIDKDMQNYIMQMHLRQNDYLGLRLKATGPEFETGKNYYVEAIYPRVGVMKVPIKVDGKIIGETVELVVMKSDNYPSVIWNVANEVATYAAA